MAKQEVKLNEDDALEAFGPTIYGLLRLYWNMGIICFVMSLLAIPLAATAGTCSYSRTVHLLLTTLSLTAQSLALGTLAVLSLAALRCHRTAL